MSAKESMDKTRFQPMAHRFKMALTFTGRERIEIA